MRICTWGTSKQELILGLAGLLEYLYLNYILLTIELPDWPRFRGKRQIYPNSSTGKISTGGESIYKIFSAEPKDLFKY